VRHCPAELHAKQVPGQQVPSVQLLLAHSTPCWQAVPLTFVGWHTAFASQKLPATQGCAALHESRQVVAFRH
jgi:hypothetical protein